MKTMLRFAHLRVASLALMLLNFAVATGAPVAAKHAQLDLVAKQAEIAPGSTAFLGIHFVLESGWHIYWKNPGDSGQPPAFQWRLPQGFTAGDIEWPVPERLQASLELADYGYKDDVLLLIPLKVEPGAQSGTTAQIILQAKWLICREVCLPDRAELKLSLPVGSAMKENPSQAKLFASAQQRLPKRLPRGWKAVAVEGKDNFILKVSAPRPLKQVQFFPADPGQIDNAARQLVKPAANGASVKLKRSDLLLKPIAVLRGVLSLGDGQAYEVEAPVRAVRR